MSRRLMVIAGFWLFALSPSFVDIQQEAREGDGGRVGQIVAYYIAATVLVWSGLFSGGGE